jgi:hypothetical protein
MPLHVDRQVKMCGIRTTHADSRDASEIFIIELLLSAPSFAGNFDRQIQGRGRDSQFAAQSRASIVR